MAAVGSAVPIPDLIATLLRSANSEELYETLQRLSTLKDEALVTAIEAGIIPALLGCIEDSGDPTIQEYALYDLVTFVAQQKEVVLSEMREADGITILAECMPEVRESLAASQNAFYLFTFLYLQGDVDTQTKLFGELKLLNNLTTSLAHPDPLILQYALFNLGMIIRNLPQACDDPLIGGTIRDTAKILEKPAVPTAHPYAQNFLDTIEAKRPGSIRQHITIWYEEAAKSKAAGSGAGTNEYYSRLLARPERRILRHADTPIGGEAKASGPPSP